MKKVTGAEARAIIEQIRKDPNNIIVLSKAQLILETFFAEKDPESAPEFTQIVIHTVRMESGKPLEF